jgi:hypothetical protein
MARPTVLHQGFFVPNAQDVTQPALAEPDRIDFNISGNARWGVLSGCLVTVAGTTATNTPGVVLVNGVLVEVTGGQNSSVGSGGTQDRFDLIGVDDTGKLVTVPGSPSLDPVFPDPPLNVTVLAAVGASAGGGNYADNVIDKRNMLADSLKTKLSPDADMLFNRNGSGNLFHLRADGRMTWQDDLVIQRSDEFTLRVSDNVLVDGSLTTGISILAGGAITATGKVTGSNLRNAGPLPAADQGALGDVFTSTASGKAYVKQQTGWEELATLKSSVPVGTVITSLQDPGYMTSLGWIPLDGSIVTEAEAPALFTVASLQVYINTPPSGPRTMQLPDARRRVMLFDPDLLGRTGGAFNFTVALANMPPHKHNSSVLAGGGANPQVRLSRAGTHRHNVGGGEHAHPVTDPGHAHYGADRGDGGGFICAAWGGRNKIDAFFNDRSHTYSVEMALWTRAAFTGISIGSAGSGHVHYMDDQGDHDHQATIDPIAAHPHSVQEDTVGGGQAVQFTPAYLAVYAYVRG